MEQPTAAAAAGPPPVQQPPQEQQQLHHHHHQQQQHLHHHQVLVVGGGLPGPGPGQPQPQPLQPQPAAMIAATPVITAAGGVSSLGSGVLQPSQQHLHLHYPHQPQPPQPQPQPQHPQHPLHLHHQHQQQQILAHPSTAVFSTSSASSSPQMPSSPMASSPVPMTPLSALSSLGGTSPNSSSSSLSSLSSSPSGGNAFVRSLLPPTPEGGGSLTGSGEVVLGMQSLRVGGSQTPDRTMSEDEKEKFVVNVMQELQKRRMVMEAIEWLRANYRVGASGFTSKRDVYNHFMRVCKNKGVEPKISHTFFGKIVKRAFPNIKYNRKGPRGATQQCYTFLQRITTDSDAASENINVSCMTEDDSMLMSANPLLPRTADERERKEEYDFSASSHQVAASVPMTLPDPGHSRRVDPTPPSLVPHQPHSAVPMATAPTTPATLSHYPVGTVITPQPAQIQGPQVSGSPSSSYVIFSLPQVAAPCPCSHCTNATTLTSFSIPSISSTSNLPPQIHSLPPISNFPSIPSLPSLIIQAAPTGSPAAPASSNPSLVSSPTMTSSPQQQAAQQQPDHQVAAAPPAHQTFVGEEKDSETSTTSMPIA